MLNKIFYNPTGFMTLLTREVKRFFKVYVQTILAPLLSNVLFLGVFGGMFQTREVGMEGVGYLDFLVPGLAVMGAIMSAFQNPSFSIIAQKYQGTIQDINSFPMSTFEKVLAFTLGGTIRGLLVGTLTYVATIFFVGFEIQHPALFFLFLTVISFIFSSLGVIAGLFYENFDKMNFLVTIILTPLVYFGGVFFEISKLPGFLANLVYINPIYPFINLVRFSYLGVYEGNLVLHIAVTVVLSVLSFFFAMKTLDKGIGLKV